MRRKLALLASLLSILFLTGCSSGGGFDIVQFLKNPIVMVIIGLFIVVWMWKRGNK
jgi:hypothetical protein